MTINKKLNHTAAHLLAAAILKLYPDTLLGFGPATEEGFYYDFLFANPISDLELKKIEKKMYQLARENYQMIKKNYYHYDFNTQKFKHEYFLELKQKNADITFYSLEKNGKELFVDMCLGNHEENTSKLKHFKLLNLAGAYWRGKSENPQLTRIYGTAWETQEQLENFINILEERKERNHRKIGKDLKIFYQNWLAGQGFNFWLENGMKIKRKIEQIVLDFDYFYGFKEVFSPHFGEKSLYQISGHWDHYQENIFNAIKVENEILVARPMTCPHHILIFSSKKRSYREMPVRYSEQSLIYRYEKSGALLGLERVRGMELTDAHIFARKTQIKAECQRCFLMISQILKVFNIKIDHVSLSLRDKNNKDKFFDDDEMWENAEKDLKDFLDSNNIDYQIFTGEAAFYGPKIDIQIKTSMLKIITIATIQLDFLLPKNFKINFINEKNQEETPVIIHRGLIGTYERFIATILEQTKGILPFWLSPNQIEIIPVDIKKNSNYANEIYRILKNKKINVTINLKDERLNKKIRESQVKKTKMQVIIGDLEEKNKTVSFREYGKKNTSILSIDSFLDTVEKLNKVENVVNEIY